MSTKVYGVRLPKDVIDSFISYCEANGVDHREVIYLFMCTFVRNKSFAQRFIQQLKSNSSVDEVLKELSRKEDLENLSKRLEDLESTLNKLKTLVTQIHSRVITLSSVVDVLFDEILRLYKAFNFDPEIIFYNLKNRDLLEKYHISIERFEKLTPPEKRRTSNKVSKKGLSLFMEK